MLTNRQIIRGLRYFLVGLAIALGIAACNNLKLPSVKAPEPFPDVAAIPTPDLPDWIEQISPIDETGTLAQIRIRFKDPLIPLESLESPQQQDILKQFELQPNLPGRFRFLTPRMVGFQADQAIPKATRCQVTLKSGLADLENHQLAEDLAWTFNTEPIKLTGLPGMEGRRGSESNPIDLEPTLEFRSNVELDLTSLKEHVAFKQADQEASLPIAIALKEDKDDSPSDYFYPQEQFDPSARSWLYTVTPQRSLQKAARYQLTITPGLRPAVGNLISEESQENDIFTYSPLKFNKLLRIGQPDGGGAYGRFVNGAAQLEFNNGLVAESAVENITIEPAAKEAPQLVQSYDGSNFIRLNPWSLDPDTQYTITLGADLEDEFGQTLGEPVTMEYDTGDVAANLWVPSGLNIFPAEQDLQLNISTVNLPDEEYQAAFAVVQPTDLVYTDSAYPQGGGRNLLPDTGQWKPFPLSAAKNQPAESAIPLKEQLKADTGMVAYGVQARTNSYQDNGEKKWREPTYYGLVQLTNLGVFAQWFPESGLVRVHHLSDGSAVAAAQVEIYPSKLDENLGNVAPKPCATGQTDALGTLLLSKEDLQQCHTNGDQGFAEPPKLLVIAREKQDWAFVRTLYYSGSYRYGIYADWEGEEPLSRGEVFSDRQLYQPGETAWFTGTAYYLQNGALKQDKNVPYTVTINDPEGTETDLGTQTTNDFGTFSLEWSIPPNPPLGTYSIQAKGENGVIINGAFRVAEFKPPNFKVDLTLDKKFALINQTVDAQAQSNYLFGPPVEGGKAAYYVTRTPAWFIPSGWDQFNFGRRWYWPEERPRVSSDVLQVSKPLDDQGAGQETVTVADDLPYPMTYRVDVEVSDVSNLSVANSQTFTALPSDRLIGLDNDFVADAGEPFSTQVIVTDPTGKALAGQRINLELQQIIYSSVTQVVEGSRTPKDQVEYKTVDQAEIRSGNEAKAIELTPPEAGAYRIRANFVDAKDELTATDSRIWATGAEPVYWGGRYTNNRLEIKLDKPRYKVGETATALIESPYPEAELYFAVIRHDTLYRDIAKVEGGAPQIQFKVTPEMLPNAAVEAVLVRQGEPLDQVEPGSLENLVRIGLAPFETSLEDQYLSVDVSLTAPDNNQLRQPGEEQTVQLALKDNQGQPIKGQFTVMVVNEAVLQLTGYRPPDLVETVYADQPISTRFADNRPDVTLAPLYSPLEKGWGYGGGDSAGAASTRVREDFKPLAYYNGSVLTDDQGQAEITFTLPDDLTTWRVMAVATDGDLHFGNGDATFITSKPLISNPLLPQFARPGDLIEAGVAVVNTTDQPGDLTITGELGEGLQFVDNDQRSQTKEYQTQAKSGTQAHRFPVIADGAEQATVQFNTQLADETDAFRISLPIKPLEITEQVVESGVTTDQVTIPVNVAETVATDAGGLEVSLASTLITDIKAPAEHVLRRVLLPCLEPAASQLAIAANLEILSEQYDQTFADFDPADHAAKALKRIQKLQRPDGGFAAWPGFSRSDPFLSAYAAEAIAQAEAAGFNPDAEMVKRLQEYLTTLLANPGRYDYCQSALCKNQVRLETLIALAALGDTRNEFLPDLYQQRDQFDQADQIRLARYLSQFPDWETEATDMAEQIQETIYETGRTATVNLPPRWSWFNSTTTAQAQALQLFVDRESDPEVLARLLQGLLGLRRDGDWRTSYDNAQALRALVAYSQRQPTPPNFEATVQLAGKTIASEQFEGYRNPSLDVQVPMAELPKGDSELLLQKSGEGDLHYLAAYRYRLEGDQPGRLNGLRVTRDVHPANQEESLYRLGLAPNKEPLTVKAGQVFDIGLEIITDHPVDHLIITDPLPAGFEAVDTSFQTSTPYFQAQQDSWRIGYQTIYRDRVLAYGDHLEAGVYSFHYLVRSVTPGTFLWPGANVYLQYAPEEFGRSASAELQVSGG
ncbi:MAG: alpha-2-macroglobulin [Leptolyngbyaceae cyanobacterium MO_188.B28]|nr:alpha-2-macroglobulin [Leptolyngbyaceae cyanobacterium MO_188.B28]